MAAGKSHDRRGAWRAGSINPGEQFMKLVHDKIVALLGDGAASLSLKGPDAVTAILLVGLQGSGETTTAAKLALRMKLQGRRVMLAAATRRGQPPPSN